MRLFDRDLAGVIFDMDGLMLDTERVSMRAWQAGCREQGFELTDAQFLDIIGHREADCIRLITTMHGDRVEAEPLMRATRAHYARLLAPGVPVMPGLRDALAALSARGLPLAVATSTHQAVAVAKLERAGVLSHFRAVVGGDQAPRGKPAPDLYLLAAEHLGLAPESCLALEDSGPGLAAAHAAGCVAVLIPDLKPPSPEVLARAHRVLPSMRAFADLPELAGATG